EGRTWTYAEFLEETRRLAKGLHALGVRKGDKVAVLMGNQVEWLLVDFAVTMLGGVLVALNTWWRQKELQHALVLTDTSFLVMVDRYVNDDYLEQFREMGDLSAAIPTLREVVHMGAEGLPGSLPFSRLVELGSAVPDAVIEEARGNVLPDDPAYLLFTSGS